LSDGAESGEAVSQGWRSAAMQTALQHALNRIQCGVILTSVTRRPSFINTHAHAVLSKRDALLLIDGVLHARTVEDTQRLQRALASEESATCTTLSLQTGDLTRRVGVHVLRLPDSEAGRLDSVLFLSDPRITPVVSQSSLRALFGLTRAEAVFADLLVQGHSIEAAADRLCVSVHTARTHVKRILLKTDTGRQGELVRVMVLCAALFALD
jgi:DNA-binding CsgD family transcriptional regulator